jgi:hypothetical protein
MKIFLLLAFLPGIRSTRLQHELSNNAFGTAAGLCASQKIQHACAAVFGARRLTSLPVNTDALTAYLVSTDEEVSTYLRAVRLRKESFTCESLCESTVRYSQNVLGYKFTAENGIVCLDGSCKDKLDLSPDSVADLADEAILARSSESTVPWLDEEDTRLLTDKKAEGSDTELRYTTSDIAHHLCALFDIYSVDGDANMFASPSDGEATSFVEGADSNDPDFGPLILPERRNLWRSLTSRGTALVRTALVRMANATQFGAARQWLGNKIPVGQVREMLQKMLRTLMALRIKKGDCSGRTLAYVKVWTNKHTKEFVKSDRDSRGHFVVHVCTHFWSVVTDLSYKYGTLIHEASHHWGTDDVALRSGETAYGRAGAKKLVSERADPHENADNWMWAVLDLASSMNLFDNVNKPIGEHHLLDKNASKWKARERVIVRDSVNDPWKIGTVIFAEPNQPPRVLPDGWEHDVGNSRGFVFDIIERLPDGWGKKPTPAPTYLTSAWAVRQRVEVRMSYKDRWQKGTVVGFNRHKEVYVLVDGWSTHFTWKYIRALNETTPPKTDGFRMASSDKCRSFCRGTHKKEDCELYLYSCSMCSFCQKKTEDPPLTDADICNNYCHRESATLDCSLRGCRGCTFCFPNGTAVHSGAIG